MSSPLTSETVLAQLRGVKYPGYSRDIVSFGMVKDVQIDGARVSVRIAVTTADAKIPKQLEETAVAAIESIPGVSEAVVHLDVSAPVSKALQAEGGALPQTKIDGIKHIIAVASGKGGVGKSTVAANLAIALRGEKNQARVGLCDCDIYGPSIGLMFGTNERPTATEDGRIQPICRHGHALHAAISAQRRLGRTRLSRPRSASGNGRHSIDHRANRRAFRRGNRHHSSGGRPDRRTQRD